ncbi:MAG: hypothetical protein ABIO94_04370 [Opitutaceae bacterium]
MATSPHQPDPSGLPQPTAKGGRRPTNKAQNRLLALGSAAVLAVYAAGYLRTRSAANRFDQVETGRRHPTAPAPLAEVAMIPSPVPLPPATPPAPAVADPKPATIAAAPPIPAATNAPVAALPVTAPPAPLTAVKSVEPLPAPTTASVPTAVPAPVASTPAPVPENVVVTPAVAAKPAEAKLPKWKDGTFSGWGYCRHGEIQATLVIKEGRIVSAIVSICQTRYSCDVIAKIIPQVVERQSAEVDTVSRATQSADAFYGAVTSALALAAIKPVAAAVK